MVTERKKDVNAGWAGIDCSPLIHNPFINRCRHQSSKAGPSPYGSEHDHSACGADLTDYASHMRKQPEQIMQ